MPDLTIENYWMCEDLECFDTTVVGSTGKKYAVSNWRGKWHCDCKSFKYRGHCKHVEQAEKKRCSWHQHHCGGKPVEKKGEKCCPRCGGPVRVVQVGV